jgi:hypothetical protein
MCKKFSGFKNPTANAALVQCSYGIPWRVKGVFNFSSLGVCV